MRIVSIDRRVRLACFAGLLLLTHTALFGADPDPKKEVAFSEAQGPEFADPKAASARCVAELKAGRGLKAFVTKAGAIHAKAWTRAADGDDGDAHHLVGLLRQFGVGGPASDAEALKWYRRSADRGNPMGLTALGNAYRNGFAGLSKDPTRARALYLQAVEAGDCDALVGIGGLYLDGRSPEEAARWLEKAAGAGYSEAMNRLGILYDTATGVARDHEKAFEWYMKAARSGNPMAMHNVAVSYRDGEGVRKDLTEAQAWQTRAVAAGYEPRPQTARELPPEFYLPNRRTTPFRSGGPGTSQGSMQLERLRQRAEAEAREAAEEALRNFRSDLRNRPIP